MKLKTKRKREIELEEYAKVGRLPEWRKREIEKEERAKRIPNGRLVPARIRHKGKTYPGKVKRVNGRVKIFVTPQVARKINPRQTQTGTRYRGVVVAIPGNFLHGGARQVVSSWFATRADARKWVRSMEQPGIETHRIEVGKGRIDIGPGGSWVR